MSTPADQASPPAASPVGSRRQVYLLIALFFMPLLVAFIMYYGLGVRPAGGTNKGDLINPPVTLPDVELLGATNEKLPADTLHGKWTMVFIGDGACDSRCREALTLMRQTRLALGDDMQRVQRAFFASANCCDNTYLNAEHKGLLLARIDNPSGQRLLQMFPESTAAAQLGRIYLVDPLGNLMMKYEADAPQKGLLQDLKKLLKLSHIG